MKIQVRYAGTTKTPVINYHVFADGLRVGFVKMDKTKKWLARDWRYRPIGTYSRRADATHAVILRYQHFTEMAPYKNLKAFNEHAIRFNQNEREKPKAS